MNDTAVVLMAYGSPERLADVPAYYADIRGGRPIRPELLADLVERYRRLGIEDDNPPDRGQEPELAREGEAGLRPAGAQGLPRTSATEKEGARGGTLGSPTPSPLNRITEETRAALERELGLPVYTGMRHWRPRIADAVEAALAGGARTIVGLVLAPHYSSMSIGGYRRQLEEALASRAELRFVESWGDDPGFVDLLAEKVRGTDAHVVFTAHSLPARILGEGDPYEEQLLETARLVVERAGLADWSFSYQSESATGEPWLGPDILDHLADLHARGVQDVLVCPVGFVADHLEIRWDLDTEAAGRAAELGMRFARTELPNAEPAFVAVLAGLSRARLEEPVAP